MARNPLTSLALALAALAVLATPALADSQRFADPREDLEPEPGREPGKPWQDFVRATQGHTDTGKLRHDFVVAAPGADNALNLFSFFVHTGGQRFFYCWPNGNGPYGRCYDKDMNATGRFAVKRLSERRISFRLPRRVIGTPSAYHWQFNSEGESGHIYDRAPDAPAYHQL